MADVQPSVDTPPAVIPATSPAAPATPPQQPKQETVVLTKEAHDQLLRDSAVGKTAQKEKVGLESKLNAMLRRKVEPLPPLEAAAVATVKSQVSAALISDPKYLPLLQKTPMLAKVLAKNPLDLLDRDEFIDERDATNQVLDFLDGELANMSNAVVAPTTVIPTASAPHTTNPGDEVTPTELSPQQALTKEQQEANAKLPPMRRLTNAIAGRLKISP